ncbi:MAG: DUF1257 domain-containing protein [Spirochaetales bacterium]|jgi:hypothetical protein|nr:DUF1257 domain-containing protein [Spirochaetales bacterium]
MSHIAKIETQIRSLESLRKALDTLDMNYVLAPAGETLSIAGFGKNEIIEGCRMEIKTGSAYSIGIRRTQTGYEAVADWWAVETFTGHKQEEILSRITRQYAYETVMDKIRNMGFSLVREEQDANANIRISVRRWEPA